MSAALDRVVAALEDRGLNPKRNGKGCSARCPAHKDDRASLSVGVGDDGKVLLKCFAGCKAQAIVEALRLTMADLFNSNGQAARPSAAPCRRLPAARPVRQPVQRRKIVATYDYRDESGVLLFQVCRFDPKDFRQRRADGAWNMQGVRRVLYRLPELLAADPAVIVFIVEGEKDCDNLRGLGLVATCNPMGAGKWSKVEDAPLQGRHVVIVPDADDTGDNHAQDVAARLHGRAASVRILRLPLSEGGKDASDFIEERRAGGKDDAATRREIEDLATAAPEWEPPPQAIAPAPRPTAGQLDERAARALSRDIFKTQETFRGAGVQLCRLLARFHDGGGFEALGLTHRDRLNRTHRTLAYFAGPWGVSVRRVQQIIERGRLLETNEQKFVHLPADQLAESHLAALLPLSDDPALLEVACRRAVEIAGEEAQDRPNRRPRVTARVIRRVVNELRPGPVTSHPGPRDSLALAMWNIAARWRKRIEGAADVPPAVVAALDQLYNAARDWALGAPMAPPPARREPAALFGGAGGAV